MGWWFPHKEEEETERHSGVMVALTPEGKRKAEGFEVEEPVLTVLSTLSAKGRCSPGELARDTHLPPRTVVYALKKARNEGLIITMNTDEL